MVVGGMVGTDEVVEACPFGGLDGWTADDGVVHAETASPTHSNATAPRRPVTRAPIAETTVASPVRPGASC
jgi:hypothetical protein